LSLALLNIIGPVLVWLTLVLDNPTLIKLIPCFIYFIFILYLHSVRLSCI